MAILVASDNLSPVSATSCAPESSKVIDGNTEYTILQFKTVGTCTWTVPTNVTEIDYLIVAGGGGGGRATATAHGAGGGGAGGYRSSMVGELSGGNSPAESKFPLAGDSYTVTVGSGGLGQTSDEAAATNGTDSVFATITTKGGGRGADYFNFAASQGGSGGGGAVSNRSTGGVLHNSGALGASNQGSASGNAEPNRFDDNGGGGGGAEGEGGAGVAGGAGGSGLSSSISGTSTIRAAGGAGGGGASSSPGSTAAANTGNGGGGGSGSGGVLGDGGNGGSGIVIVRYIAPPSILKIGNDEVLNQSPLMLVDPRSSSVAIPFVRLSAATDSRICVDLFTDSSKNTGIELKNTSAASSFHRLAISDSATGITTSESNTVNSSTGMKLTGTRSNVASMLNPSVSANESYLRLFKPDAGWVNGSVLRIRADYATASDCSGVSGSEVAMDTQIKIVGIELNQKNDVTVN